MSTYFRESQKKKDTQHGRCRPRFFASLLVAASCLRFSGMNFSEVWKFDSNVTALSLECFPAKENVANQISSKVPVARMISLLLPETDTSKLEKIFKDSDYYSCEDFQLTDVITKNFIDGFLKNGKFFCIPSNVQSFDDSFSFINNKLLLKLHKDSLNSIHAVELSRQKIKPEGDFITITIDLLEPSLETAKLNTELKSLFAEKSVDLMWNPDSKDTCPSSIAKYFSDAGRIVALHSNKVLNVPEYGLTFPVIPAEPDAYSFTDVSEYVGLILLGCSIEENDFSSYRLPSDCIDIGRGNVIHSKGFLTQQTIMQTIAEVRQILIENPDFPWIAMSIIMNSSTDSSETRSQLLIITKDMLYVL